MNPVGTGKGAGGAARAATWRALLIGVDSYADARGIPSLDHCAADAHALAEALTFSGVCAPEDVRLVTDGAPDRGSLPLRPSILAAVPEWLARCEPDDVALVFFAGRVCRYEGKDYLLPADARIGIPRLSGVPLSFLGEQLAACRAALKVVVLDPHNVAEGRGAEPLPDGFAAELEGVPGLVVLASCGVGQEPAPWQEPGRGAYVHFLTEAVARLADTDSDGRITVADLHRYAAEGLAAWGSERGIEQTPTLAGEHAEEMVLARRPVPAERPPRMAAPPPPPPPRQEAPRVPPLPKETAPPPMPPSRPAPPPAPPPHQTPRGWRGAR